MALYKPITQEDGVRTDYHRILALSIIPNSHISIIVVSYVDNDIRKKELENTIESPYMKTITYETSFDESMNTSKAYEYLKSLKDFEGATDI